jgi:hypothetical protein
MADDPELLAQWSAVYEELSRMYSFPFASHSETDRDRVADRITELWSMLSALERKLGWEVECGNWLPSSPEWDDLLVRREEQRMQDWLEQLPAEERAELERGRIRLAELLGE